MLRFATILLFLSCFILSPICQAAKEHPVGFYFDFADCGGERLINFSASVTPYPALYSAIQISMWLAGTLRITDAAKQFAQNVTVGDLLEHLRAAFFTDELSNPILGDYFMRHNNTPLCNSNEEENSVAAEFFQALHAALLAQVDSTVLFVPLDINETTNPLLLVMWIILKEILEKSGDKPQLSRIRAKIQYLDTTLLCVQWNVMIKREEFEVNDDFDKQRMNYENAFATPKINNSTSCPLDSREIIQNGRSSCSCKLPHHAGPNCMLQCDLNQIDVLNTECLPTSSKRKLCGFTSLDYSTMCLRDQIIPLLNRSMTIKTYNFSLVNVRWTMMNYFAMGPYIVKIQVFNSEMHSQGLFTKRISYYEGMENELNVTCVKQSEDDKTCSNLKLESFSNYTLILSVRYTAVFHNKYNYITAGTMPFLSPEDRPQQPHMEAQAVNETHVHIAWFLRGHCPGIVTFYKANLWCLSDGSKNSTTGGMSLSPVYDCRTNETYVSVFPLPSDCNRGDVVYVELSVATNKGFGPSNKIPVTIPTQGWSVWVTIVVSVGGFVLATVVFSAAFIYYYKTHIETWKRVHNTVAKLLRRPLPKLPELDNSAEEEDGTVFATPTSILSKTNTESNTTNQNSSCITPTFQNTLSGYSSNGYGTPIFGII